MEYRTQDVFFIDSEKNGKENVTSKTFPKTIQANKFIDPWKCTNIKTANILQTHKHLSLMFP